MSMAYMAYPWLEHVHRTCRETLFELSPTSVSASPARGDCSRMPPHHSHVHARNARGGRETDEVLMSLAFGTTRPVGQPRQYTPSRMFGARSVFAAANLSTHLRGDRPEVCVASELSPVFCIAFCRFIELCTGMPFQMI